MYLSTAFTKRTKEEIEYLKGLTVKTGFCLYWLDVIKPLLCEINAKEILEIGAERGEHTQHLIKYCEEHNARLTVIEPVLLPDLEKIINTRKCVTLLNEKGQDALPRVNAPIDAVMLEGDLNYYSVYKDLAAIKEQSERQGRDFPLVFVRSISWPYARRDMYYDPDSLPDDAKHSFTRKGISLWSNELEDWLMNYLYANADHEGGQKNGVKTAVEDFIDKSGLELYALPIRYGVGIIYYKGSNVENYIKEKLQVPSALGKFIETCEIARLNEIENNLRKKVEQKKNKERVEYESTCSVKGKCGKILRSIFGEIIRFVEKFIGKI